jgi:hypothetical protein
MGVATLDGMRIADWSHVDPAQQRWMGRADKERRDRG